MQPYISVDYFKTGGWDCRIPCEHFTSKQRIQVKQLLTESQYKFDTQEPHLLLTEDSIKTVVDCLWPYTARWTRLDQLYTLLHEFPLILPAHSIGAFFAITCSDRPYPKIDPAYTVFLACDTEENAVLLNLSCTGA